MRPVRRAIYRRRRLNHSTVARSTGLVISYYPLENPYKNVLYSHYITLMAPARQSGLAAGLRARLSAGADSTTGSTGGPAGRSWWLDNKQSVSNETIAEIKNNTIIKEKSLTIERARRAAAIQFVIPTTSKSALILRHLTLCTYNIFIQAIFKKSLSTFYHINLKIC